MSRRRAKMINHDFGKRLSKLLEEKGIKNNNRFAQAIKRQPMVTGGWLKGKVPRLPEDWKVLCDFFNVSLDFLLLGKEREKEDRPCKITVTIPIPDHDRPTLDLNRFLESQVSPEEEVIWYLVLLLLKKKFAGREESLNPKLIPEITHGYALPSKK
jgi:hypothetical protein